MIDNVEFIDVWNKHSGDTKGVSLELRISVEYAKAKAENLRKLDYPICDELEAEFAARLPNLTQPI